MTRYTSFTEAWDDRHTMQFQGGTNVVESEWAKGRETYLTFIIPVEDRFLTDRLQNIQRELAALPSIETYPKEYFHVTVRGIGFLREEGGDVDDVHPGEIDRIAEQAGHLLQFVDPFTVHVENVNVFPNTVVAEVHDNGKTGEVHDALERIDRLPPWQFAPPHFLPHISLARFVEMPQIPRLMDTVESLRDTEIGLTTVDTVQFIQTDLTTSVTEWDVLREYRL